MEKKKVKTDPDLDIPLFWPSPNLSTSLDSTCSTYYNYFQCFSAPPCCDIVVVKGTLGFKSLLNQATCHNRPILLVWVVGGVKFHNEYLLMIGISYLYQTNCQQHRP